MKKLLASLRKPNGQAIKEQIASRGINVELPAPDDMAPAAARMYRGMRHRIDELHLALHTGDKRKVQAAVKRINQQVPRLRKISLMELWAWGTLTGIYLVLNLLFPPTSLLGVLITTSAVLSFGYLNYNISRYKRFGVTDGKVYFSSVHWLKLVIEHQPVAELGEGSKLEDLFTVSLDHALLKTFVDVSPAVDEHTLMIIEEQYLSVIPNPGEHGGADATEN